MGIKVSYREASRTNWTTTETNGVGYPGLDNVNAGSLQRIADATEVMAKNYNDLMRSRDWWKEECEAVRKRAIKAENQVRTYKGVVTKQKLIIDQLRTSLAAAVYIPIQEPDAGSG